MHSVSRRAVIIGVTALVTGAGASRAGAGNELVKSAGGLTIYIGIVPAEIIRGHPLAHPERKMHGGPPSGAHRYHLIASIFEGATGTRISDVIVTAKVSGLGLSGSEWPLESMQIADTTTFGAFIYLPGKDLYTIALTIRRPAPTQTIAVEFKYDHRN